jgi:hypothetical protein
VKVMPCKPGRAAVMERQVAATAEVQRGNPQRDFDDFLSCSEASIRSAAADGKASRLLAPPMVNCSSSRTAQRPQRR